MSEKLIRSVNQVAGMNRVIYTTDKGTYLGCISFEGSTQEALRAMLEDFRIFIAETTGSIVLPPSGNGLNGGRRN
jgi:hypothetical protein